MMSAAVVSSANADRSVLLASKMEKIAVALHDGDGDRILDPQVTPLLLLIVSSGSLSRRCPPSSFVAAQRAVRRQGRRVARRLRRCALFWQ
jgi:hypothetical protein